MKNSIFVALFLMALIVCAKSYSIFTQNQTVGATAYNSLREIKKLKQSDEFSFEKLISSQQNTSKKLNWITPEYAGLKLGKATQNDVLKYSENRNLNFTRLANMNLMMINGRIIMRT